MLQRIIDQSLSFSIFTKFYYKLPIFWFNMFFFLPKMLLVLLLTLDIYVDIRILHKKYFVF